MIPFISSFEIINLAVPYPKIFSGINASVAAATVKLNSIITLLANGLSIFFIKGRLAFSNGPNKILWIVLFCAIEFLTSLY